MLTICKRNFQHTNWATQKKTTTDTRNFFKQINIYEFNASPPIQMYGWTFHESIQRNVTLQNERNQNNINLSLQKLCNQKGTFYPKYPKHTNSLRKQLYREKFSDCDHIAFEINVSKIHILVPDSFIAYFYTNLTRNSYVKTVLISDKGKPGAKLNVINA